MKDIHYDLCVIGGGINGAGIARDAAGRGLSVIMLEAQDIAGATSSASTKLIHGGLRYLEYYAFGMVREALKEREVLYHNAPHIIEPIECVLPYDGEQRSKTMLRTGLWLYDRIGGRSSLPRSRMVSDDDIFYTQPLASGLHEGFVYTDCWADDTRLVVMNARDAAAHGAKIMTYTMCEHLTPRNGRWRIGLRDTSSGERLDITASMVVNATGPWVNQFLNQAGLADGDPDLPKMRLVKGSHLILPRQYDGHHAYVLQQPDGRVMFVAPYERNYTLVGTTEEDVTGDPRDVRISDTEMAYLCDGFNAAFDRNVTASDVAFTFSGVRPLYDSGENNASAVSRDYLIYNHKRFEAPFLSVYGGKLTTYRALSEDVVNKLMRISGRVSPGWTAQKPLIGGDFRDEHGIKLTRDQYIAQKMAQYPWLPVDILARYVRAYGTLMVDVIREAQCLADLGTDYGDGVYQAEIDYLMTHEWVGSVDDMIWRRSKLGLHISDSTYDKIAAFFTQKTSHPHGGE